VAVSQADHHHARGRAGSHEGVALVLLAGTSGAVDALAFIALGHVFAGVMTGNLVLLGLAATGDVAGGPAAALLALGGYVAGAALAALITRRSSPPEVGWQRSVLWCLAGELPLLVAAAVLWGTAGSGLWGTAGTGEVAVRRLLLVLLAAAMGIQSAALLAAGSAGGSGTYFTGMLTGVVARLSASPGGKRGEVLNLTRLGAVTAGAVPTASVRRAAPGWAAAVPAGALAVALGVALAAAWYRARPGGPDPDVDPGP
jgi:uncharacterized membrane protein YoaK (UPF0700 family)